MSPQPINWPRSPLRRPGALLKLGYRCNDRCRFCHSSPHRGVGLSTRQALARIRRVAEAGLLCGDCDLDGQLRILDALLAARIAVGLESVTPVQTMLCDVDSSGDITVVDALRMAQAAASLGTVLTCQ